MLIKIIGVAFITAISALLLRQFKPELAMVTTIAGIIVLLLFLTDSVQETLNSLQNIAQSGGMGHGLIKILLKIVGIGYIAEFSAGVLNDFGSQAMADKVLLGSKIVILTISLPIFESLLTLVSVFLGVR